MKLYKNNIYNIVFYKLIIIHIVGVVGLNLPLTQNLFRNLSWLNLLLSALVVHFFMQTKDRRLYFFYLLVFVVGLVAEIIGVHTQLLFGSYYYTSVLGFSIFGVPLIIGINWVVLTFCTAKWVDIIKLKSLILKILLGSILMVALDILLEFFAVKHQLWIWNNRYYPTIQNFVGWFVVSCCTHFIYRKLWIKTDNAMAKKYLLLLILFLLIDYFV